jgi:hypothetical protein
MSPLEALKSILDNNYVTEDGDNYKVELKPGLSDKEIDQLAEKLPTKKVPYEIRALLKFSKGFAFAPLEEVSFDGIGKFGMENIFPFSVQLAGDGFGNFWILDIDSKGAWGAVFFVCHDPAVIVKQSNNLSEFILQLDSYAKKLRDESLDLVPGKVLMNIWNEGRFFDINHFEKSEDESLKDSTNLLGKDFVIADLRNAPNQTGFAWGKFAPNIDKAVRYKDTYVWAFEKKTKKGLFSRIFG